MFVPKINVKDDPIRRWQRLDRHFFANGACQVLAFAFLQRYPDLDFHARWIRPAPGFSGNHIEGLWLREPNQFLYDALPRARAFLDRFGDLRSRLSASASCTSPGAG
jgi:hypothetical protein